MKTIQKFLVNLAVFALGILMISFITGIVILVMNLVRGDGDVVGNVVGLIVIIVCLVVDVWINSFFLKLRDKLNGRSS